MNANRLCHILNNSRLRGRGEADNELDIHRSPSGEMVVYIHLRVCLELGNWLGRQRRNAAQQPGYARLGGLNDLRSVLLLVPRKTRCDAGTNRYQMEKWCGSQATEFDILQTVTFRIIQLFAMFLWRDLVISEEDRWVLQQDRLMEQQVSALVAYMTNALAKQY